MCGWPKSGEMLWLEINKYKLHPAVEERRADGGLDDVVDAEEGPVGLVEVVEVGVAVRAAAGARDHDAVVEGVELVERRRDVLAPKSRHVVCCVEPLCVTLRRKSAWSDAFVGTASAAT